MADVFSKEKRSQVMSRIRGHGNKDTEVALIKIFKKFGITGWRRKQIVFGNPDFVFRKEKLAIFVDGCFWHQCPQHSTMPKNNKDFWQKKLLANVDRDHRVNDYLVQKGWVVVRIWEHELKNERIVAELIKCKLIGHEDCGQGNQS